MTKKDTMPQVASYWNKIATDFDAIYSGEGKTGFAKTLDQVFRKDIYQRFDWVMEKVGDVKGQSICDVGCGSGRFVAELAKRGASKVMGVDVAPSMIKLATELTQKAGVASKCKFEVSDVLNWKPDQNYDITIAIGFWDYIMDPPERLKLIRKFTNKQFLSAWPRYWTWRMPVRKVRLEYLDGCPVYFFKKEQVYKMLEESGYKVISCETVGKLFCVDARPV